MDKRPRMAPDPLCDTWLSPAPRPGFRWGTLGLFVFAAMLVGGTVAGPGLSWDEPAYRHSQVTLQQWCRALVDASSWGSFADLFSADAIDQYWEFNRFGHNFHPPMASYLNLITYALFGGVWDDISARRLASALEFAAVVALLGGVIARRYGPYAGLVAALSLLFMPRVVGDAHVIGTDMPMLLFWVLTAVALERGLTSRKWQWLTALAAAGLFLVKFSGVVIAVPLALWFGGTVLGRQPVRRLLTWGSMTFVMILPLIPAGLAFALGWGVRRADNTVVAVQLGGFEHPAVFLLCLAWPAGCYLQMRRPAGRTTEGDLALELPWVILAATPLLCIALNPTFWHDPVLRLARYFDLNIHRHGHLPSIGIFYLGQRYFYSLPWHNAYVLMAVTLPVGVLLLGILGCVIAAGRWRHDRFPIYLVLHAFTLPAFRMLPTPAHDGVRLFLPTFFFWAGLAGIAAAWLVARASQFGRRAAWVIAVGLGLAGPGWAAIDWIRVHPYELSYYNVGLARAVDWGFEATYWYDAVTPRVLNDLNARLPPRTTLTVHVDPLINPEVFSALEQLGRLRPDLHADPPELNDFAWVWLLTHASKATAFTRLLYACEPWYASGHAGVRLFSVIDARSVKLAFAIRSMMVAREQSSVLGSLALNEWALAHADRLVDAVRFVEAHPAATAAELANAPADVRGLVESWRAAGTLADLGKVIRNDPAIARRAAILIAERRESLRQLVMQEGYPRELAPFGGYLTP